jgi:hypothetical protein
MKFRAVKPSPRKPRSRWITAAGEPETVEGSALIRPYIGLTREDPPSGAKPVHLSLLAFLRPEAL